MIIDFNKYSMGGGGSGGGSGSDPNAVKYTEQSLTDAQKAQARTNIGATAPEIFLAEYDVTTAAEIDAAVAAGKQVFCKYGDYTYVLSRTITDYYYFATAVSGRIWTLQLKRSTDVWATTSMSLEDASRKKTSVSDNSSSDSYYPTTKAVYDFVTESAQFIPVDTAIPSGGLDANVHYDLGTLTGSVSITLDTTSEVSGMLNIYSLAFTAGSTAPTITWPSGITNWAGNCLDLTTMAPVISGGNSYEVSIVDGMAVITEFVA